MATKATPVTCVIARAACSEPSTRRDGDRTQFYHRQVTLMLLPGAPPGGSPFACSWIMSRNEPKKMKWPRPCVCWSA